jgi:hypothetical protein
VPRSNNTGGIAMGRWSDMRFAKKHGLDKDYNYGELDQIVFVGETTYRGGPDYYFKNGWPGFSKAPLITPEQGKVSNVISTSTNPLVSIAYAWYKSNSTKGQGWLYMVWCRRGFEYRPFIEKVGGKGAANDEVVMVSIEGYHILAGRKVTRDEQDATGGAILGEIVENPKSKFKEREPARYKTAIDDLTTMQSPVSGLLDIAAQL